MAGHINCNPPTKAWAVVLLALFICVVYLLATQYAAEMKEVVQEIRPTVVTCVKSDAEAKAISYRKQRDDISKELNQMMRAYGQLSCEQIKEKTGAKVSLKGGWCAEESSPESKNHLWDKSLSTALSHFLKSKTVASFGDGPGMYKKHLDSLKEVKSYTAYDGAPFCESATKGIVQFLDLTASQYGLPVFDWVVSVEVGEHIPAKYEDIYFDNLVRHAKEGIILSWAVPGQDGLSHVNNKPLVDVIAQMNKRGFDVDKKAGEPLRAASQFAWLKNNIHVYYRKNNETFVIENA